MKIDIFAHILPDKYRNAIEKNIPAEAFKPFQSTYKPFPAITDLDLRFKIMDRHKDYTQVLTHTVPFLESVVKPDVVTELVKMGNDELAELVAKYPDRFIAAIGNLPMHDIEAALDEIDRVINSLKFKGIQICTDIKGKPLDLPEFMPIYQKMQQYDLPILLHPARSQEVPDYATENISKYKIHHMLGWPYDTSAAMVRLVLSHVLENYPRLKFITHHCGAMIPFLDNRVLSFVSGRDMDVYTQGLSKKPLEYFKMFYGDTALQGSTSGLMCGYAFFGADHILFGTDMPYGSHGNHTVVEATIESIEQMDISKGEKEKIFAGNTIKLLKLQK